MLSAAHMVAFSMLSASAMKPPKREHLAGLLHLIAVLALPELPDDVRSHALRVFNGLLSTQSFAASNDGNALLNEVRTSLVPALVELLMQPADPDYTLAACENAAATLEVLAELLNLQHRETVKHAAAALMGLAVEKESKVNVMLFAGVQLVRLMRGKDTELANNARDAVAAASEHLDARRTAEMLLSMEERELLLWRGPPPETPPDYRYNVSLPAFVPPRI
ncbi:radial spoke protein 8 [Volvox carteri f. nagariensis]|uniref:Radial spoke protein 8 n=1 Tax=Volvox carteri f. nagariensis TaxID=3068 RepID=D8U6E7_VOLCA|nr:radial spoke protein 8 [Volvox carteri f. nagariensis]EFJ44704.1 radial spoke protein 8 [Volvox carteri f. nagariensis]|eukprot:XP_002954280.1 radial spoke protein 8 [Volvox carteri f. nagariensis]